MTEQQGTFTIPTQLFLTAEQRTKLDRLVRSQHTNLAEIISQVVCQYLDTLPLPEPVVAATDQRNLIRQRRAELSRLRARRVAAGEVAPAWLSGYIAELEAELQRLEG